MFVPSPTNFNRDTPLESPLQLTLKKIQNEEDNITIVCKKC